jgi:hypothetical protein
MQNKTIVYVDGFNLYYRALKGSPYKWLDLRRAFTLVLGPNYPIQTIKYYTARINGRFDPDAPTRQDTYLRALKAHSPDIEIYYGHFLVHPATRRLVNPPHTSVTVLNPEEKGSDVNLAVHLVTDAWLNAYDSAFIVTNDSDFLEAVKRVHQHHPQKNVGVVVPGDTTPAARELARVCRPFFRLRGGVMSLAQLPNPIPNTTIHKPPNW